jgi:hypothetical protein
MSVMSELHQEILEMLEQGDRPIKIATLLDIPVSLVYEVLEDEDQSENYSPFETVNS